MTAKIIPKKSTVASKVPDSLDLEVGEVAINLTDAIFYAKHPDGSIVNLSGAPELHTHTISQISNLQSSLDGKVDKITGKGLSTEDYTTTEKNKLDGIESGAEVNSVDSVNGNTGAVNLTSSDVGLGDVRNVSSYSQTEADGRFVNNTGDSMTGTYTINTTDDGVNDLQVGGDSSLRGNTGLGNDDPSYRADIEGDARVRDENGMKFGGSGAGDAQYSIQYNASSKSLDFNFIGG